MKVLIVPTQNFSLGVKGHKKITSSLLPAVVQLFLGMFGRNVFCALDESSFIKINTPQKKQESARAKMIKYLGAMVDDKVIATGTLMSKTPLNLYNQFQFLDPGYWGMTEQEFAEKYVIMKTYQFGAKRVRKVISKDDVGYGANKQYGYTTIHKFAKAAIERLNGDKGAIDSYFTSSAHLYGVSVEDMHRIASREDYFPFRNIDALMEYIEPDTVTVKRSDVFDIKNDKFVYEPIVREVVLSTTQQRLYDKLVKDGFTENFYLGKAAALDLLIRLQDVCNGAEPHKADGDDVTTLVPLKENPKLEELLELIDEIGEQVVVWTSRTFAVHSIAAALDDAGISYCTYTGEQSKAEKAEAERRFSTGEAQVFIGNIASAGFGLNSLKDCNYMVWYCCDSSVEKYHQAQHRILRKESQNPKFAYYLVCKGTVEDRVRKALIVGEELIQTKATRKIFERQK